MEQKSQTEELLVPHKSENSLINRKTSETTSSPQEPRIKEFNYRKRETLKDLKKLLKERNKALKDLKKLLKERNKALKDLKKLLKEQEEKLVDDELKEIERHKNDSTK